MPVFPYEGESTQNEPSILARGLVVEVRLHHRQLIRRAVCIEKMLNGWWLSDFPSSQELLPLLYNIPIRFHSHIHFAPAEPLMVTTLPIPKSLLRRLADVHPLPRQGETELEWSLRVAPAARKRFDIETKAAFTDLKKIMHQVARSLEAL